MTLEEFIREHRHADVHTLALRMRQYPELDAAFALQQIEGWQRASRKLPELAAVDGWLWPKRVSVEQCSSQATALYKKAVLEKRATDNGQRAMPGQLIDITGGMGVDTFYMSKGFEEVHYVEQQEELCRLAEQNFQLTGKNIHVHCREAVEFLKESTTDPEKTVIFADPARRDKNGGKVFRLEDCEPNVVEHLSLLRTCARTMLLKLSPMLDITEAVRSLGGAAEVHVVAVKNEVKEVLVLLESGQDSPDPEIVCVNMETEEEDFVFRRSEESERSRGSQWTMEKGQRAITSSAVKSVAPTLGEEWLLVEPNAAIQKAGGWNSFAARFGLLPVGPNSHLFYAERDANCMQGVCKPVSQMYITFNVEAGSENEQQSATEVQLPGRIFRVKLASKEELKHLKQANVICRNYPMSADALKKQLGLRDGGENYLIATQIGHKPIIFLGTRQFFHI